MTREWKRQEKHGHSSFFFSSSLPSCPLFSCLFRSFYTGVYSASWHVARGFALFPFSCLASFARRQLLDRPDVLHAIYHIVENSRPLVDATTDKPNFLIRVTIKGPGFKSLDLILYVYIFLLVYFF